MNKIFSSSVTLPLPFQLPIHSVRLEMLRFKLSSHQTSLGFEVCLQCTLLVETKLLMSLIPGTVEIKHNHCLTSRRPHCRGGIRGSVHLKSTAKTQVSLFPDNLPTDFFLENWISTFNMQIHMQLSLHLNETGQQRTNFPANHSVK